MARHIREAITTPPGRQAPTNGLGRLDLVPDLPRHLLPRAEEVEACCEKLLGSTPGAVVITAPHKTALALHGMGGAGKSVLANAVARDERVRRRFADGIFWVTVGQDNAGTETKATAMQSSLASRLGSPLSVASVQEGKQQLRTHLADRACLVILDDVWETVDAQRMDVVEPSSRSRILITTREGRVVTDLDADEVPLGTLSPEQAVKLLSDWCGTSVAGNADALSVARECGYLPLALAVCGAMARDGASWTDIASGLSHADLSCLEPRGLDQTYESVLKSIDASVNHLNASKPQTAQRYRDLAVFPSDEAVPESVVAMLWAETTGCLPYQAGLDLISLERKSLLTLDGVSPRRRVSLHDLQHDYVKGTHPDLRKANHQLLQAYRGHCPAGWARGPDDGYFFQHLPYHLREAGRGEEILGMLLDCEWLEAKLRATDVVQLIADYEPFAENRSLGLVRGALRLSANPLVRDPSLLRGQLHGRLLGIDSPEIQRLLGSVAGRTPWLRPLTPSLTRPGGELIQSLEGHADWVNAVAVTPDGQRAVSASGDRSLKVWELGAGTLLRSLEGHTDFIWALVVTPDGQRAVSASHDRTLKVWDLARGTLLCSLKGHLSDVYALAVTRDGQRAVSASWDKTVKVWDLGSGTLLRSLEGHAGSVYAVAVTPDGQRAVSASDDKTLKVWDLDAGKLLRSLEGHAGPVNAVAVTPDGQRAVSASNDKTVKVWDLGAGMLLHSLEGHTSWVSIVTVTPDGRRAVSASDDDYSASPDRTLKVWDLDAGKQLHSLKGHAGPVTDVVVTPDSRRAVSASEDKTLKVWDLDAGKLLRSLEGHAGPVKAVAVTPDGNRAISASHDKTLRCWEIGAGTLLRPLEAHADSVNAVAVTPDGKRAISASDDRTLKVWDLGTGILLRSLKGHTAFTAVAVTPDGRWAVSSGSLDTTLRVWDLEEGKLLRSLEGHEASVKAVAVTPDGKRVVSASTDMTLRVWDLGTGRLLRSLEGNTGPVTAVAVTPDGRRAVSASSGKTLQVWDLARGRLLRSLRGHAAPVTAVAVTPDGKRIVSASDDKTLKVWDLGAGWLLRSLEGHTGEVYCVAVTSDGQRAVSASEDRTVKVWDLAKGTLLATFATDYPLSCCAVSPTGETLVAAGEGGQVHFLRWERS